MKLEVLVVRRHSISFVTSILTACSGAPALLSCRHCRRDRTCARQYAPLVNPRLVYTNALHHTHLVALYLRRKLAGFHSTASFSQTRPRLSMRRPHSARDSLLRRSRSQRCSHTRAFGTGSRTHSQGEADSLSLRTLACRLLLVPNLPPCHTSQNLRKKVQADVSGKSGFRTFP